MWWDTNVTENLAATIFKNMQQDPLKCCYPTTSPFSITTQKTITSTFIAVEISNLT
jgi:hypothetical protein